MTLREKGKRTLIKQLLESPFDFAWWKLMDEEVEKNFLNQLCALLKPVAAYRKAYNNERRRSHKANTDAAVIPKPEIRNHLILGINDVSARLRAKDDTVEVVIVCYNDLQPQALTSHIPGLAHNHGNIILVPLRKGAESRIAEAMGMARVGALAIRKVSFNQDHLSPLD